MQCLATLQTSPFVSPESWNEDFFSGLESGKFVVAVDILRTNSAACTATVVLSLKNVWKTHWPAASNSFRLGYSLLLTAIIIPNFDLIF